MSKNQFKLEDAKKANIRIIEEKGRGVQAVNNVIVAMNANKRSGSAHTKTRGEVSATGKKPFKQKGTGRARQGGNASPIHKGGGVVFGPRFRSYSKKVNKSTKKLAFSRALTDKIKEGDVFTSTSFSVNDGKTKTFLKNLEFITENKFKTLLIGDNFSEEVKRAGRNVSSVLMIGPNELNTEHLLRYDKVLILEGALNLIATRTAVKQ